MAQIFFKAMQSRLCEEIIQHYERFWSNTGTPFKWKIGRFEDLPDSFAILEFAPTTERAMWTYATCGMSSGNQTSSIEIYLFSPIQTQACVELLTVIAHYHQTGSALGFGHTVNFGRPWLPGSKCNHGLISLPYLDGADLEYLNAETGEIRFLWLIPITSEELDYKKTYGLEALEEQFDQQEIDYLNPTRKSVI